MSSTAPLVAAIDAAETAKEAADIALADGLAAQTELANQKAAQDALVLNQQAAAADAKEHLRAAGQSLLDALAASDPPAPGPAPSPPAPASTVLCNR